jgi:hypothetical protein
LFSCSSPIYMRGWEGEGQDGYKIDDGVDWSSKAHRFLLSIMMAADQIGSGHWREGDFSGRRQCVVWWQ